MKAGDHLDDKLYVFYCPKCDGIHVLNRMGAYVFKNEGGFFIHVWELGPLGVGFKMHDFYLIGEL